MQDGWGPSSPGGGLGVQQGALGARTPGVCPRWGQRPCPSPPFPQSTLLCSPQADELWLQETRSLSEWAS